MLGGGGSVAFEVFCMIDITLLASLLSTYGHFYPLMAT